MAGQAGVVERELRVQADETMRRGSVSRGLGDDRQRVDLDEIGVIGLHGLVQALGDGYERIQQRVSQADRQTQGPSLEREEPELRVGRDAVDRAGVLAGHFLDLDAALRGGHEHYPAAGPVDDGAEVVLLDDLGGGADEDLADGDALDVHPQDLRAHLGGLYGGAGELDTTGLAAPADQNLGLDDYPLGPAVEEDPRCGLDLCRRPSHFPRGHGQSLGQQERLRVSFLDLHALQLRFSRAEGAGRSPQQPRRRLG